MSASSSSAAVDHSDPNNPPPPKWKDMTDEQKAERAAIMKERKKKQTAQSEKTRDRSERKQASGCANDKKYGKKAQTEAERADKQRRRSVINYHRKAARAKKKPRLDSSEVYRIKEEKLLLGDNFVFEGQRVLVTKGEYSGCEGTVLERAVLYDVTEREAVTAIVEPEHHHSVLLDEDELEAGPRRISPHDVEPWPRVGQQVGWLPNVPSQIATVTHFHGGDDNGSDYILSRRLYASPATVEAMAGGPVRVGTWVRLLPPHTEAEHEGEYTDASDLEAGKLVFSNDSTERLPHEPSIEDAQRLLRELKLHDVAEFNAEQLQELATFPYYHRVAGWHAPDMSAQPTPDSHPESWVASAEFLPLRDVYVVRAVCPICGDCLELECVTAAAHDTLEPLGRESERSPCCAHCNDDHMFKCTHMGHAGECVYSCAECESDWSPSDWCESGSDDDMDAWATRERCS